MPAQSLRALHDELKTKTKDAGSDADAGATKGNGFSFAPELIEEEEGFNTRGAFLSKEEFFEQPKIKDHIRKLADAYKRGDYLPPLTVKVVDGRILIRDGHCRMRAIRLAISEGTPITRVRVEEQSGDEAAQTLLIVTSNDGAQLSVLERAMVFGRLKNFGWDQKKIAEHVGLSTTAVRNMLAMLELPLELKQLIQRDKVSATYAMELFNEYGTKAVQMIADELAEQEKGQDTSKSGVAKNGEKQTKVTKKKLSSSSPRMTKQVINDLRSSFLSITTDLEKAKPTRNGTFLLEVTADTLEQLNKLKESIAEPEGEDAKNPNQMDLV
ncbi:ParB/RepB/Spo0J family partition protein [Comamonas thiooxydans]|uniref:ParB/RepB/Spo0J family partition protein n=1 Tax=Comamonas thiooxydans TaxID=363952 RepID=UPI00051060FD|nr:ParB/RepB/Spo0J family partition protein [Comamonas thiooxydans]KGH23582.1 hypothetical protein P606_11740 [Comamonas thiooxydans]